MQRVRWIRGVVLLGGWLCAGIGTAFADDAYLRLKCDGDAAGAVVTINGVAKGECPIDLALPEGTVQIFVRKDLDAYSYRVYQKEILLPAGGMKRETIVLGPVQFTPEGQQRENERLAREKAAADARAAALAEEQRIAAAKAAEEAQYGETVRYLDDLSCKNEDVTFLLWLDELVLSPVALPLSTLTDVSGGKKLVRAAVDPAVFGNPQSMVARAMLKREPVAAASAGN